MNHDDLLFFVVHPRVMAAAWANEAPLPFSWLKLSKSKLFLSRMLGKTKMRAIIINVTELARQIALARVAVDSAAPATKGT